MLSDETSTFASLMGKKKPRSFCFFQNLPPNVFYIIASYLGWPNLFRLGYCSRSLWDVIRQRDELWPRSACLSHPSYVYLVDKDDGEPDFGFETVSRLINRFRTSEECIVSDRVDRALSVDAVSRIALVGCGRSSVMARVTRPEENQDPATCYSVGLGGLLCIGDAAMWLDDVLGYHNGAERMRVLHYRNADLIMVFSHQSEWSIKLVLEDIVPQMVGDVNFDTSLDTGTPILEEMRACPKIFVSIGDFDAQRVFHRLCTITPFVAHARVDPNVTFQGITELFMCAHHFAQSKSSTATIDSDDESASKRKCALQ